jgi:hypothetical protein
MDNQVVIDIVRRAVPDPIALYGSAHVRKERIGSAVTWIWLS